MGIGWSELKRRIWPWRGVGVVAPIAAVSVLLVRGAGLLQGLEWAALDQLVYFSAAEAPDSRIVIIGLTESDLQTYGWPLPDRTLAQLIQTVKHHRPRAIGLDLYRDLPVEPGHTALSKLFASTPNLIGIEKVGGDVKTGIVAAPPILKQLGQVAANDVVWDGDGKVRRGLLYLDDHQGNPRFGLGMALAMFYLQAEGIEAQTTAQNTLQFNQVTIAPFHQNDGSYVRTGDRGYQVLLNYRRAPQPFQQVSVQQVLQGQWDPRQFQGRLVLIGPMAESLKDFVYTPHGVGFMQVGQPTPGVEIHAHLASQILSQVLDGRSPLRHWQDSGEMAWIIGWAIAGAFAVGPQSRTLQLLLRWLLGSVGIVAIGYGAMATQIWIPVVPPLLAFWGAAIGMMGYRTHTARKLRHTLGRYLTDDVVASLLETPEGLKLGGEKRTVTTLMADIRGFTSLSGILPPEQLVTMLNYYISSMTTVIQTYGGTINDLTGDGIVVFFGAPLQRSDDSERAVACAIAMQLAMIQVNQHYQTQHFPSIEIGIGINTGEVVLGNIGSQTLAKYTAIGAHVNLAARIESFTTGRQILLSEHTFQEISAIADISSQLQTYVKGVQQPITLYEVQGIRGKYSLTLPDNHEVWISLKHPIQVVFNLLKDKWIDTTQTAGAIVSLSAQGAEIICDRVPPPFSNLKITLDDLQPTESAPPITDERRQNPTRPIVMAQGSESRSLYAKVLDQPSIDDRIWVRFTDLPPNIAAALQAIRSDRRLRKA